MGRGKRRIKESDAARETGKLLCAHVAEAVAVLAELMLDVGQKPELRMKAAESILDRVCGKAGSAATGTGETAPASVRFEGVLEEWSR